MSNEVFQLFVEVKVRGSLTVSICVDTYPSLTFAIRDKNFIERTQNLKCEIRHKVFTDEIVKLGDSTKLL